MLTNLKLWLDDFLLTVRLRISEYAISCKQTKLCWIGGGLLLILMLLLLLGCSPQVITRCGADRTLLSQIQLPVKPEKPINGDLAASHRNLSEAVILDNAKKEKLAKQLQECQ